MNFILRVSSDLTQIAVQQPGLAEDEINNDFLKKITACVEVIQETTTLLFTKQPIEFLSGIRVPAFIYYIKNIDRRLNVVIHDFEGYDIGCFHPVTGDLNVAFRYSEPKLIPHPLNEPVDSLNILVDPSEKFLDVEFLCNGVLESHRHIGMDIPDRHYDARRLITKLWSEKC